MATRLRLAREALGVAQWVLAEGIGVTGGFLSQVEAGRKTPTLQLAERIVQVLNGFSPTPLSIEDLFPGMQTTGGRNVGAEAGQRRQGG